MSTRAMYPHRGGRPRAACRATGPVTPPRALVHALERRLLLAAVTPAGEEAVPVAPTNLRARPYGPNEIRVSWTDRSSDETGFRVQRRAAGGTFADVVTVPAGTTAYVDPINPAEFPVPTSFEYQVFAFNDAGPSAPANVASVSTGGAANGPAGTGLRQRIWNDINPAGEGVGAPAVDRVDPFLNHNWGEGAPAPGIDPDTFAVEWVGEVVAEETKNYIFSVAADRGARLFLNDVLVTRGGGGTRTSDDTAYEDFTENLAVTAGQKIKVRLQYADHAGAATACLRWNGPGNAREEVPSVFLFPTVGPADAVDQVARRPVSYPNAFGLPPQPQSISFLPAPVIGVSWQDNAFGEAGYEIQRATDAWFTQNLKTVSLADDPFLPNRQLVGPGRDLFVDDGGFNPDTFAATPLDPNTTYYYRVRPLGAPDTAWVTTGGAKANKFEAGRDYTIPSFPNQRLVTLNGDAVTTAEGTLRLANNQNFRHGSAYVHSSFDVATDFKVNFDFQISNSTGGDGMTFVIHNHRPAGAGASQLKVLGGSDTDGSGLGYRGIPSSVAVTFDVHQDLDQVGLFTNGAVPAPGNVPATRVNDPATWPLDPNGTIDLRQVGNGAIDLNNGRIYDFLGVYNNATKVFLIEIRNADAWPGATPLFTTTFMVDLPATVGGDEAVMGFTAANGGLNSDFEVHNFKYDGPNIGPPPPHPPQVREVYVRGTSWQTDPAFGDWLEANSPGSDDILGYRVDNLPANTTVPWTNVNEIVIRYDQAPGGIPQPAGFTVDSTLGGYTVTAVTPVGADGTTFALTLDRALGVLPSPAVGTDGDRVQLSVAGGGAGNTPFNLLINSLQGDANRGQQRVNTTDVALVRSRLNRRAAEGTTPAGVQPYSGFVDLNANGVINAQDVSAVRARLNDTLPPVPAPAAVSAPPSDSSALFGARRIRPGVRSDLAELLA